MEKDPKESSFHRIMNENQLTIMIKADHGVTPCEPYVYWSIWVQDEDRKRVITECTEGAATLESLFKMIESSLRQWKKKYGSKPKKKRK